MSIKKHTWGYHITINIEVKKELKKNSAALHKF